MSKESRQKKEVRRAKKALRHAVKRIKLHLDCVAAGKPPPGSSERTANRRLSQEQQHRAAAIKVAAAPAVAGPSPGGVKIDLTQAQSAR